MIKKLLLILPLLTGSVCHAEDITVSYNGTKTKVTQRTKDSVKVTVNGANVNIVSLYKDHKLTLRLKGKSDDGQLTLKTAGKARVTLDGTRTDQVTIPFSMRRSASLVSSAAFRVGGSYTVRTKDYEKAFTISENFTVVR